MCRNIRRLHNLDPRATPDELRDAALQFVRKISGTRTPSKANERAFERAVKRIAKASCELLADLTAASPPSTREQLAEKARQRWQRRQSIRS